jgi:3,4-dihydroxy 2-butanone 4-phosphate synthase/GTP cyclohydrolase II
MIPIEELLSGAGREGRPLVTLSYAQSLDGSLAEERGKPLALSGPQSMKLTHQLRAAQDAILVGIGTVLADNPRLTVRLVEGPQPQPVILDSQLRFPLNANLLNGPHPPWIAATGLAGPDPQMALQAAGVRVIRFPPDSSGRVPLPSLLEYLAKQGVKRLMVEGGARVISSFLSANLVDRVLLTIAPRFVGGLKAFEREPAGISLPMPNLQDLDYDRLGDDLIVWGKLTS